MFKCASDCLDERNTSKQAEKCIDDCGSNVHKAMTLLQKEMNSFQVSEKPFLSTSIQYLIDFWIYNDLSHQLDQP